MDDVERVHVGQPFQKLVHEDTDQLGIEAVRGFLQDFQQVVLDVLEDKIDDSFFAEGFFELDDGGVPEHFENLDFPHGGFLDDFVLF